jgi:hypothetical protein
MQFGHDVMNLLKVANTYVRFQFLENSIGIWSISVQRVYFLKKRSPWI